MQLEPTIVLLFLSKSPLNMHAFSRLSDLHAPFRGIYKYFRCLTLLKKIAGEGVGRHFYSSPCPFIFNILLVRTRGMICNRDINEIPTPILLVD